MSDTPKIPDAIDHKRLAAMREVARMKELADRVGSGFIGGFVDDNGEMFVMTNMEELGLSDRQLKHFMQGFQDGMKQLEGER